MRIRTAVIIYSAVMSLLQVAIGCHKDTNGNAESLVKYVGIYKYDYEYNTKDLKEDHYIVLETVGDELRGRYYGTSDDFDEGREGYLPGFYVAPMRGLHIAEETISFTINITDEDLFNKSITLDIASTNNVPAKNNPKWNIRLYNYKVHFKGKFVNGQIHIKRPSGTRIFKRMDRI